MGFARPGSVRLGERLMVLVGVVGLLAGAAWARADKRVAKRSPAVTLGPPRRMGPTGLEMLVLGLTGIPYRIAGSAQVGRAPLGRYHGLEGGHGVLVHVPIGDTQRQRTFL